MDNLIRVLRWLQDLEEGDFISTPDYTEDFVKFSSPHNEIEGEFILRILSLVDVFYFNSKRSFYYKDSCIYVKVG